MTNLSSQKQHFSKPLFITSIIAYVSIIVIAVVLLLTEPTGFDARGMILPLIVGLLITGAGVAHRFTAKSSSKALAIAGTVALAILFTFIGFFIVAAIGFFIAQGHAR